MRSLNLLPGRIIFRKGTFADYLALERFHYRKARPATVAGIWVALHRHRAVAPSGAGHIRTRLAAVAVLSYPTLACAARDKALGLHYLDPAERIRFINANVRTISRVIVHPTYRSIGLAAALVRRILRARPARYIETLAVMAHVHTFFDAAGMRRVFMPGDFRKPVYFLHPFIQKRWQEDGPRDRIAGNG
jgi:GNAT superfamily N-acetyltransferase